MSRQHWPDRALRMKIFNEDIIFITNHYQHHSKLSVWKYLCAKYCKFIDQHPLHIYVQQNWVTYVQNGGVHNIHCICAKCANKMDCLRVKCAKKHEKLNSLRAPRCRAHCPCHCSSTNRCGHCSKAFDMKSFWQNHFKVARVTYTYEKCLTKKWENSLSGKCWCWEKNSSSSDDSKSFHWDEKIWGVSIKQNTNIYLQGSLSCKLKMESIWWTSLIRRCRCRDRCNCRRWWWWWVQVR